MADQTDKQLNLAQRMVNAATTIDDILVEAEQLAEEFPFAGAMTDQIFEGTALQHVSANDMATLISGFTGLIGFIDASNRRDIFRRVRP